MSKWIREYWILIVIVVLSLFLRFYMLGSIPAGVISDEADTGYDAYSILLTGKDQWGISFPFPTLKGFGDYRLALYTYLTIPFIKIFDLSIFAVRFPSFLFGSGSVVILYFIAKKLFEKKTALCATLLFAISPWAIGMSRIAIESTMAIFFLLSGILFLITWEKHRYFLWISYISFILAVFSYTTYIILTPLFILSWIVMNRHTVYANKRIFIPWICGICFIILMLFLVNKTAGTRFSQVGFMNGTDAVGIVSVVTNKISSCSEHFPLLLCRIFNNKVFAYIAQFMQNYINHFSPNFLYISGTSTQYSILPPRGLEYMWGIGLLLIGLVFQKKFQKSYYFILCLLLLAPIADTLTGSGHHSRSFTMLPFLLLLEGYGFMMLIDIVSKINVKIFRLSIMSIVGGVILFSVSNFFINYLTYFDSYYSEQSQFGYEQLMKEVFISKNTYDKVYLSLYYNDTPQYIYYLFFNKISPKKIHGKRNIAYTKSSDGWESIERIDNIYFMKSPTLLTDLANTKENVLLYSHPLGLPKDMKFSHTIKDKAGSVVFAQVTADELHIIMTPDVKNNKDISTE